MAAETINMPNATTLAAMPEIEDMKTGKFPQIPQSVASFLEVSVDPFYSEVNMERLRSAIADAKTGKNMTEHELIEVEDD